MIDKDKTYKTRHGHKVRIYATDGGGDYPIHGAFGDNNLWRGAQWAPSGRYDKHLERHDLDLIETKPRIKRELWVNVYPIGYAPNNADGSVICHTSRTSADGAYKSGRIACVKVVIDCEEGEGL